MEELLCTGKAVTILHIKFNMFPALSAKKGSVKESLNICLLWAYGVIGQNGQDWKIYANSVTNALLIKEKG